MLTGSWQLEIVLQQCSPGTLTCAPSEWTHYREHGIATLPHTPLPSFTKDLNKLDFLK